ncbi:MAG: hypothetical protein R3A52_24890 [Polyangiales bacterium]
MSARSLPLLSVLLTALVACSGSTESTNPPPADSGAPEDTGPVDAGAPEDTGPTDTGPTDTGPDTVAVSIDTQAPDTARAGEALTVTCALRNAAGEPVDPPMGMTPTIAFDPAESVRTAMGVYTAVRVGEVTARCSLGALSDATPARIRITPGAPARVTTTLDRSEARAGETVRATCAVTDAEGNEVTDAAPTVQTTPSGEGVTVTGNDVRAERAGMYTVRCEVPGAMAEGASLAVSPGLPATLTIARVPDQPIDALNEEVEVRAVVNDRFGNAIASPSLEFTSAPVGTAVRAGVFSYAAEGMKTITVRVTGETEGGVALSQSTSFVVDSSGPAIQCTTPGDATMVNHAPGSPLMITGSLSDTSGVRSLTVNGEAVTPRNDGTFTATVPSRFGMTFVDVSATDTQGIENSRTCTYLVSNNWLAEDALLDDAVTLSTTQAAVDDGNPVSPITSVDDLLQTVVNSRGLRDQLHATLLAANPLKNSCDQEVCVFGRCTCIFRSRVDYRDSQINGPNTTSLTLVNGGLRATVRFENLRVSLGISGTLSTSGWVTFRSVDVGVTFDLSASGGRPRATVRSGTTTVSVGTISTDFGGITGTIVNVVASLVNGYLRDQVSNLLRSYVSDNFTRVLDGVLGGLDVSSLGASFNVPRLDGAGNVPLRFGLGLSSLNANTSRLRLGLGTRFSTTATRATPSRGIALPPGTGSDVTLTTPATVTLQPGVLNGALHALWRGGFLDASIPLSRLGDAFPAGTNVTVAALLPPVAQLGTGNNVILDLGGLTVSLALPGMSAPLQVSLGARAHATVTLVGNDLRFGGIALDELHVSLDTLSITGMEREDLVRGLRFVVQDLVERSLNDALPAIPIPGFAIPSSLSTYGLPAGRELGITSPSLSFSAGRFVLRGGFGLR